MLKKQKMAKVPVSNLKATFGSSHFKWFLDSYKWFETIVVGNSKRLPVTLRNYGGKRIYEKFATSSKKGIVSLNESILLFVADLHRGV